MTDTERLDALEKFINKNGALVLHNGVYPDHAPGIGLRPGSLVRTLREAIDKILTREAVAAESCKCVRCPMCSGTGRVRVDHWSGYDTEPCEDCDNGIVEVCGRCEYLADLDRERF